MIETENKMGVMPPGQLLISMSLPMVASMLIQACYNIVDSIFVAQISENALTAVSLAFPIQSLMISVGTGTGVGINALLSRSLGEKNFERVNKTACTGVMLGALNFAVFAFFGLFLVKPFFATQTNIPEIAEHGVAYLSICTLFSFGVFGQLVYGRLLQGTGKTFYSMITQGTGAIINIILDPIMIFGLFGFPRLEVTGAAIATVVGQIAACCMSIYFNYARNHEIQMRFRGFRPEREIVAKIYSVGVPSIIMASIGSVMVMGMNRILIAFTPTAVAVYGIYFKLQSFVFMPVFGLNNGMVPILAYNFGARHHERIVAVMRLGIFYATVIMLAGLAVFWTFTPQILACFKASPEMVAIGIPALRIISLSYVFAGFCICVLTFCQALGHGLLSLLVALVRQLIVLLPSAFVLSKVGGLDAVWWAVPLAEIASVALCGLILKRVYLSDILPLASGIALPANPQEAP